MDDVKTLLSQYQLVISSLQGQIERLENSEKEQKQNRSENIEDKELENQNEIKIKNVQQTIEEIQNFLSLSKFDKAIDQLKILNNMVGGINLEK